MSYGQIYHIDDEISFTFYKLLLWRDCSTEKRTIWRTVGENTAIGLKETDLVYLHLEWRWLKQILKE